MTDGFISSIEVFKNPFYSHDIPYDVCYQPLKVGGSVSPRSNWLVGAVLFHSGEESFNVK